MHYVDYVQNTYELEPFLVIRSFLVLVLVFADPRFNPGIKVESEQHCAEESLTSQRKPRKRVFVLCQALETIFTNMLFEC